MDRNQQVPPQRPASATGDIPRLIRTSTRAFEHAETASVGGASNVLALTKSRSSPAFTPVKGTSQMCDAHFDPSQSGILSDSPSNTYEYVDHGLHSESFETLFEFFKKGTFCDIKITVGDTVIACHRLVLACFSTYFRSMFTWDLSESHSDAITIKDIDESAFRDLITFAYTARITMTTDTVQTLLYACSILQVESVQRACCQFMTAHLHPSNCVGVRNFADQHGQKLLAEAADEYILENFADVVACDDEFAAMTPRCLETIISSPDLNVRLETQVYEAVIKWLRLDDQSERASYLVPLMSHIKFPLLPPAYLQRVCSEPLLKQNMQCRDFLDEAQSYQLSIAQVFSYSMQKLSERMRPRKSYAGVIFCVGGRGASGNPFKTIECYDLLKDRWFQVAEMSTRRRHVGVVTVNGKLYAVGGHDGQEHLKSGEVFDPTDNKWHPIAPMSKLRRGIALAYLNGPIYAVGGLDDLACFNTVERYDPESDTWTLVQPMNCSRGGVAVAAYRGFIYAIGGNNGSASLETCERYDPHLNKWSMIESMNKRRAGAGVAELNEHLYVVGGFDDNSPLDCVEQYNAQTSTWTMVAHMSCPRGGVGVAALGGKLYAVGGHDGTNYLSSVEEYDPITDRWSQVANIGTCRAGAGVAIVACHCDDLQDVTKINMIKGATGRL